MVPISEVLQEQTEQLMAALRKIPGTMDIKQDWNNRVFTMKADVDQTRARRAGVTSKDVADTLEFFIDGSTATDYHQGNVQIPIVGRGVEGERYSPDSTAAPLGIRSSSGGSRASQSGSQYVRHRRIKSYRPLQSGAHGNRQR